ncbi:VanW family protein [Sphingomonas sp. ASY06-1R]|uniref:VanW family protein n=1 Tax=Sphingomonas sp. ASY06-1R TaxID=3445771 RepID=UPI003FA301DA
MANRLDSIAILPERRVPTRVEAVIFATKAWLLRRQRALANLFPGAPARLHKSTSLRDAPIIASIRSPLRTTDGGALDRLLNAGKIHNLRVALRGIDGVEVPAEAIFSFWRQVGKPVRRRGFVAGRELREGCMIAAIGGGLCQLSNALYEAALDAGIMVVERHPHTRVVPGSRAEAGRDATVFWNYIDLRLRARTAFRIEARMSADMLEIMIRGTPDRPIEAAAPAFMSSKPHDCLSCGQLTCHRHRPDRPAEAVPTAWLVDAATPEFSHYVQREAQPADLLLRPSRHFARSAKAWPSLRTERGAEVATLRRALDLRLAPAGRPRASIMLTADARLAAAYARALPYRYDHLVIAQNLLPHLWRDGVLQGRSFDIFLDRWPMDWLHRLLDEARAQYPDSPTLGDFRAPEELANAEREALAAARHLITPHRAIAEYFPAGRVVLIEWAPGPPYPVQRGGRSVLLAGAPVARKGVHALREAIAGLDITLLVPAGAEEAPDFWAGVANVRRLAPGEQPQALAGMVLPALVEHHPALLLRALAADIPVIATPACGLPMHPHLTIVPPYDVAALRHALRAMVNMPADDPAFYRRATARA